MWRPPPAYECCRWGCGRCPRGQRRSVHEVTVEPVDPLRLRQHIGDKRANALKELSEAAGRRLSDRTVWNINSTATGGGVAEMLTQLVAYGLGAGVDTRWAVVDGDDAFFTV